MTGYILLAVQKTDRHIVIEFRVIPVSDKKRQPQKKPLILLPARYFLPQKKTGASPYSEKGAGGFNRKRWGGYSKRGGGHVPAGRLYPERKPDDQALPGEGPGLPAPASGTRNTALAARKYPKINSLISQEIMEVLHAC